MWAKTEKQRKLPSAALRLCTLPQVLRQLVKNDVKNYVLTSGTHHANSRSPETVVRGPAATSQNQPLAAGGRSLRLAWELRR